MKLEKVVKKYGHERIKESIKNNKNKSDISLDLFGYSNGKTTGVIENYIKAYDVDISHFDKQWRNRRYPKTIKKICPQCGKEFETSGKDNSITCSHKCSNLYFADKRKVEGYKVVKCNDCGCDVEVKRQTDPKRVFCKECFPKHAKNVCKNCGRPLKSKSESGLCRGCYAKSPENRKNQSKKMKRLVKEGKHKGWATRTKLKPSYPEQYFIDLFKNEGIQYIREKKIDKYFADFVLNSNIVLEVDGKQHKRKRRKESDRKKDNILTTLGYTVFRIDWYSPINESNKKKLYTQIKNFYNMIGHVSDTEKYKEVMNM